MGKRILLFIVTAFFGFVGPWWVFAPLFLLYLFVYTGVELLFVAVLIDAFFGYSTAFVGVYTLATGLALLVLQVLRPVLFVYNR